MMILSVHDSVAGYFIPPYMARNVGQAKRMFIASLGDSFPHRADFGLFHIGDFDEDTGHVTTMDPVQILAGLSISPEMDPRPVNFPDLTPNQELQS